MPVRKDCSFGRTRNDTEATGALLLRLLKAKCKQRSSRPFISKSRPPRFEVVLTFMQTDELDESPIGVSRFQRALGNRAQPLQAAFGYKKAMPTCKHVRRDINPSVLHMASQSASRTSSGALLMDLLRQKCFCVTFAESNKGINRMYGDLEGAVALLFL